MSFNISLYNTASEPNKINKILENGVSISGTLKESCSIENPVIVIDMVNQSSVFLSKNYAYISEFGRYYFITDKTIEGANLLRLSLKVDVLMSYAYQITNTPVLIERSEEMASPHITDNSRPMFNYPMVLTKKFSGSFDSFHFYLTTAG